MSFFLLLMLLLCVGCAKQEESQNHIDNKNKNIVTLAAYRHLAPGNKDAYYCSKILGVWEPLITRDEAGLPEPCLAESWEMQDDGKVWIFRLRRNVYFQNGTQFNADSVIANFDRMKKGLKRSNFYSLSLALYYPSLISYEKLDEYTVRLVFKEPNINQLYKMTDFGSPMFAPECFDANGDFKDIAIGTGPYKITKNVMNKYVVLKCNDNYWGEKGKIKDFVVRNIPNTDTRYAALKSGEIDGVLDLNAIPPFLADEIKKDKRFAVASNKSTMIRYLALNNSRFPFNDVRMRQAVSLAIDRKNLVDALYMGYAEPTMNVLNYTSPGYKEFPLEHNLAKAKKLAHEVLGDKRCDVTYCINGAEPLQKGEAELIAYWLGKIGLDVHIQSLEYATRAKMLRKGDYDIARLQKGLANGDPYEVLNSFLMPTGSIYISSHTGYHNKELQGLLQEVKHTVDAKERQRIFDRVQEIAVEEEPLVALFNDMNIVAYNKRLKNYKPLIYGVDLSKVELAEEND